MQEEEQEVARSCASGLPGEGVQLDPQEAGEGREVGEGRGGAGGGGD